MSYVSTWEKEAAEEKAKAVATLKGGGAHRIQFTTTEYNDEDDIDYLTVFDKEDRVIANHEVSGAAYNLIYILIGDEASNGEFDYFVDTGRLRQRRDAYRPEPDIYYGEDY